MFNSRFLRPDILLLALTFLLVACGAWQNQSPTELRLSPNELTDLRPAPELHDGPWLNTEVPLKLADLRGQVVLLEMWTYGCGNCQNVLPHVRGWHESYQEQGLVVIGNHYPEFNWEADIDNLIEAIGYQDIPFPVLQDNDRQTWAAYNNRYWPTIYLIDKQGHIRYTHIGEGVYEVTEEAIQTLLAEEYP